MVEAIMRAKLTRIKSSHQNLRTDEVVGELLYLPEIGGPIRMAAEGLEFGTRVIVTSPVIDIEQPDDSTYICETANSIYHIHINRETDFGPPTGREEW